LVDKRLVFNKRSADGSGKANLADSPGEVVWGVLYELDSADLFELDRAEAGYQRVTLTILSEDGNQIEAQTYVSNDLTPEPIPYDWYKQLVTDGAEEHRLPRKYIQALASLPAKPDPKRSR
jgi:hypothetical protein